MVNKRNCQSNRGKFSKHNQSQLAHAPDPKNLTAFGPGDAHHYVPKGK
jgi:hypothetical protein